MSMSAAAGTGRYSTKLRADRVAASEVKKLYVKAQQLFRTFPKEDAARPGISSAQARYYLLEPWPEMHKNGGTYDAVSHRDTDFETFKGILRVLSLMDEMQAEQLPVEDERKKVKQLQKQLGSLMGVDGS